MNAVSIENIVAKAGRLDFPGGPLGMERADEPTWRATLATADPVRAREIATALDAHAQRADRERDRAEREAVSRRAADVMAGAPLTFDEQRQAEEAQAKARAAHERHVAERPARVEALLTRIAAALEARR